jgi:hypothetical protein
MLHNILIQKRGIKLFQVLILVTFFLGFTSIANAQTNKSDLFNLFQIVDHNDNSPSLLERTSKINDSPERFGPWMEQHNEVQRIEFSNDELPANLYSEFTGNKTKSSLQYCLPANYSKEKDYPLLVYVPGFHGHPGGNIKNAIDIANNRECIVASLPLFKANIDRTEPGRGIIISFCDYSVLSGAYIIMLEKLFQTIPNIDSRKSAMVGFSNGAIAIAVLVSSHDKYILDKFQSYCLVDQGMFHLTDLHKTPTKDRRFLILVGDKVDYGRDLKIRGAKLVQDSFQLIGCSVESRILQNTGHELTQSVKRDIGKWVFEDHKSND